MVYYMFGFNVHSVAGIRYANGKIKDILLGYIAELGDFTDQYKAIAWLLPFIDNNRLPMAWGDKPEIDTSILDSLVPWWEGINEYNLYMEIQQEKEANILNKIMESLEKEHG